MNANPLNFTITVDAIVNLNALFSSNKPSPVNGQTVKVLGYNTAYDAGDPWELIYHLTGRPSADGGFYINGPGADDYWEAIDKSVAYLERFGGGPAASISANNAAFAAMSVSSASEIRVGPGTIQISQPISLEGINFFGVGIGKTIIEMTAADAAFEIHSTAVSGALRPRVEGFTVDCNSIGTIGLDLGNGAGTGAGRLAIRDVRVLGAVTYGIRFRSGVGNLFERVVVEDGPGTSIGLYTDNENNVTTTNFKSCSFRQNNTGVELRSGSLWNFNNCVIESNRNTGLRLARGVTNGFMNSVFESCWLENNGHTPTLVSGPFSVASINTSLDRIDCTGNTFAVNDRVIFRTTGTPPTNLVDGQAYWVEFKSGDDVRLSNAKGGAQINLVDAGTGSHTLEEVSTAVASVYHETLVGEVATKPGDTLFHKCVISSAPEALDVYTERGTELKFDSVQFSSDGGLTGRKLASSSSNEVFVMLKDCRTVNNRLTPALYVDFPALTVDATITDYNTLGQVGYAYQFRYKNRDYSNQGLHGQATIPAGNVTPSRLGEQIITDAGKIWQSTGLTNADWVQVTPEYITPEQFGAIADFESEVGTDNTAAFNACFAAAAASGAKIVCSPGDYKITGTVTCPAVNCDFSGVTLYYRGAIGFTGFVFGDAVTTASYLNCVLPSVHMAASGNTPYDATDAEIESTIGVQIRNVSWSKITLGLSMRAGIAFQLFPGPGKSIAYNAFHMGAARSCKYGVDIRGNTSTGWVNENSFYSTDFTYSSDSDLYGSVAGIRFSAESGGYDQCNNNRFYSSCFQVGDHNTSLDLSIGKVVALNRHYVNRTTNREYVVTTMGAGNIFTVPTHLSGEVVDDNGYGLTYVGPYFRSPLYVQAGQRDTLITGCRWESGDGPFCLVDGDASNSLRLQVLTQAGIGLTRTVDTPADITSAATASTSNASGGGVFRVIGRVADQHRISLKDIHKRFIRSATHQTIPGFFWQQLTAPNNQYESYANTNSILLKDALYIGGGTTYPCFKMDVSDVAQLDINPNSTVSAGGIAASRPYVRMYDDAGAMISTPESPGSYRAVFSGSTTNYDTHSPGSDGAPIQMFKAPDQNLSEVIVAFLSTKTLTDILVEIPPGYGPEVTPTIQSLEGRSTIDPRVRFSYGRPIVGYFEEQGEFIANTGSATPIGWRVSTPGILAPAWTTATAVIVDELRSNGGRIYYAGSAATTGATPPTHSSGTVSDGTVDWTYLGDEAVLADVQSYVTPEMFGAIGDGSNDDTVAVQAAIDASRTVKLTNGKSYLITSPLTITNDNQQIIGENQEGSELRASGITGALIAVSNADHVLLKNFKIWNTGSASSVTGTYGCDIGISLSNCSDSKIEDILFADGAIDEDAIYIEESWGIRIRDCKFYDRCQQSFIHVFRDAADASSNAITVEGCYTSNALTPRGLWLENTGIYPLGRTFNSIGNTWQLAPAGTGIQSKGAEGLTIMGDYFEGTHDHHIRLGDDADASNGWTNTGTIHTCTFQGAADACITLEQCQAIDVGHQKFVGATNQVVIGECTGCTYRGKSDFVSTASNIRAETGIMIFEQDNHGPPSNPGTDVPMGIIFAADHDTGTFSNNEHYKLTIDSDGTVVTTQWIPSAKV